LRIFIEVELFPDDGIFGLLVIIGWIIMTSCRRIHIIDAGGNRETWSLFCIQTLGTIGIGLHLLIFKAYQVEGLIFTK